MTEIYDYLRLLYARIGIPHCPVCGREIRQQTVDQIVDQVMALPEGTRIQILAPIVRGRKGEHVKEFENARKSGYVRVRVDGILYDLSEKIALERIKSIPLRSSWTRLVINEEIRGRLADSIETSTALSGGILTVNVLDREGEGYDLTFSQNYSCPEHGVSVEELTPRMFSFNNPYGACPKCTGLGSYMSIDPDLVIANRNLSIREGAIRASGWSYIDGGTIAQMYYEGLAKHYGFSLDTPINQLPPRILDILLYGSKGEKIEMARKKEYGTGQYFTEFEGVITNLQRRYKETTSDWMREELESL